MAKFIEIMLSTNNPFVILWKVFILGWDVLHWWFIAILIVLSIITCWLFELARGDTFR